MLWPPVTVLSRNLAEASDGIQFSWIHLLRHQCGSAVVEAADTNGKEIQQFDSLVSAKYTSRCRAVLFRRATCQSFLGHTERY